MNLLRALRMTATAGTMLGAAALALAGLLLPDTLPVLLLAIAGLCTGWLAGLTNTAVAANVLTALLATAGVVQLVPGAGEALPVQVIPPKLLAVIAATLALGFTLGRANSKSATSSLAIP